MYHVKCQNLSEAQQVQNVIMVYLDKSRFIAKLTIEPERVNFSTIRLKEKKGYCGNHAGVCRLTGNKHKRMNYLEGLDWVSFNDMVNDALDSINHNGNVSSSVCEVRNGTDRRMDYYGVESGEFHKVGDWYENHCGKEAPQSEYHQGTPGIFGWKVGCTEEVLIA